MKGIGTFSKFLEASETLLAVTSLAIWYKVLQVEEIDAISAGLRYGRNTAAHWINATPELWALLLGCSSIDLGSAERCKDILANQAI